MKRHALLLFILITGLTVMSQEKMYIHKSDRTTLGAPVSSTDSIYFSDDQTMAFFQIGTLLAAYPVADIDSITFGDDTKTLTINYDNDGVTLFNPLAFEGVTVEVDGSDVTVHAEGGIQDINYTLSGNSSNGSFKVYSDKRLYITLQGLTLTNPDGPAINNQANKNTYVVLADGTNNVLTDGATYAEPPNGEDQDGTFFSEGDLFFSGNGTLTINGLGSDQHGLSSDDEIEINGGTITVVSAVKDGIHANDGILITGGVLNVTSSGDGIDGDAGYIQITGGLVTTHNTSDDTKGITCDSVLVISGGTVDVTVSGDQSKGIQSNFPVTLNGGAITIHTSGDAVLEPSGSGFDPSYCTAIKSDEDIIVDGADITITSTGKAGKGLSSDANIIMNSGSLHITCSGNGATYTNTSGQPDAYVSTCLTTNGNITINGGTITTSSSGSAGKAISTDGTLTIGAGEDDPVIQLTTTGTRILVSGSGGNANYAEAKAIKSDDDIIINKGNITISSADDGIKSETSITIYDGTINITGSEEGIEAPFITINGGNIHVKSDDDGINSTFGSGGEQNDGSLLTINGGWVVVNTTGGDGLDANGNILITGGTVIVHGPPNAPEVGMDYNGSCNVNGGFLVISAPNASNMIQAPSSSSALYSLKIKSNQALSATTLFHIQDASANDVLTFQPLRTYYYIIFSSAALLNGASYSIYTGGTCTGTNTDGLYSGGVYSGGTFRKTFTISGKVTSVTF